MAGGEQRAVTAEFERRTPQIRDQMTVTGIEQGDVRDAPAPPTPRPRAWS